MPIWRRRAGGGRLSDPATLYSEIRVRERGAATDSSRLFGVVRKWATPLSRLLGPDEWKADFTGQAARGKAGQGGRNLAPPNGKVCPASDGIQSKGGIWGRAVDGKGGSGHQGRYTYYEPPMVAALPVGVLGFSPH